MSPLCFWQISWGPAKGETDGTSLWQDGEAMREAPVNPFLKDMCYSYFLFITENQ